MNLDELSSVIERSITTSEQLIEVINLVHAYHKGGVSAEVTIAAITDVVTRGVENG